MIEVEQEAASRAIRAVGARRALTSAAGVVEQVRTRVLTSRSGEAGVEVRQERTPLEAGLTDELDSLFSQLLDWCDYWALELREPAIDPGKPWLRESGEVLGFRADVAPKIAAKLTRRLTSWLLDRGDRIERLDASDEYHRDVMKLVWGLQARAGLTIRQRPPADPEKCPACTAVAVVARFWGESLTAAELRGDRWMRTRGEDYMDAFLAHVDRVTVECSACGHEVKTYKKNGVGPELPITDRQKIKWIR